MKTAKFIVLGIIAVAFLAACDNTPKQDAANAGAGQTTEHGVDKANTGSDSKQMTLD